MSLSGSDLFEEESPYEYRDFFFYFLLSWYNLMLYLLKFIADFERFSLALFFFLLKDVLKVCKNSF